MFTFLHLSQCLYVSFPSSLGPHIALHCPVSLFSFTVKCILAFVFHDTDSLEYRPFVLRNILQFGFTTFLLIKIQITHFWQDISEVMSSVYHIESTWCWFFSLMMLTLVTWLRCCWPKPDLIYYGMDSWVLILPSGLIEPIVILKVMLSQV